MSLSVSRFILSALQRGAGLLFVLLATTLTAAEGDAGRQIEPLLRSVQERFHTVTGRYLRLPANKNQVPLFEFENEGQGTIKAGANPFPPDGFYDGISETQELKMAQDLIDNCSFIIGQFKSGLTPDAEFLSMPDVKNLPTDQALSAAIKALRDCRYVHFGPGGLQVLPVTGKRRKVDIYRATLYPPLEVEWFNAGYARTIAGVYNKFYDITDENVFCLSQRSVGWLIGAAYPSVGSGFEYGFSLTYDLSRWSGTYIRPFFAITWYSGLGNSSPTSPIWPSAPGKPAIVPPLWIPSGTATSVVSTPAVGLSTETKWKGEIRESAVVPGPASITCNSQTTISLGMDFDIATIGGDQPSLINSNGYFYQIDYRGFMIDLKDRFTYPIPDQEPIVPGNIYPGSCPSCVGTIASDFSLIDNGSMTYYHDAWDYRVGGASGCAPCGGAAGSEASSVDLSLGRIHRYRDLDWGASFGPGVLCNHDLRLHVFGNGQGGLVARFFDPLQRVVCELSAASGSAFQDPAAVALELNLRDVADAATTELSAARSARLRLKDGRTLEFQLFPLQSGDSSALAGRIVWVADQQEHRLVYTYADADPQAVMTAADADVAALWRFVGIVDQRGVSASFTWKQAAGQWVIDAATMPGGGVFRYSYADNGLISLQGVSYPTGESSIFKSGWDDANQWVTLAINDAGADTTHRRKQVSLTPSIEQGFAGGIQIQLPNLVRRVINGAGELSYRNWVVATSAGLDLYNYTGGGADGAGVLRWMHYENGRPVSSKIAERYFPDQPFASHTWLEESTYATDPQMRPSEMREPDGTYTTYVRDAQGNITQRTKHRPDGGVISSESTTYDGQGNPLEVIDALGRITRNIYNAAGLPTKRTVAVGTADAATWDYAYDDQGRLLATTDANGNVTDYAYDPATGQVASIIEPGDTADIPVDQRPRRTFTYDAAGRLLTSSDQAGRTVAYSYDGRGRPTTTTYADGSTEVTEYGTGDVANLVTRRKDRNGIWEEFAYDAAGRQSSAVLNRGMPDQVTRTWAYVPGKNQVASETVNGRTTAYQYDERGRVAVVTSWATPAVALDSRNEVWDAERVAVSIDDRGRYTYALESVDGLRSRTVREHLPQALVSLAGPDVGTRSQRAQALWNLARPGESNPAYAIDETVRDVAGQVVSQIDAAGLASSSTYDAQGRTTLTTTIDQSSGRTIQTQVAYDPQGNRTQVIAPRSFAANAPGTFISDFTYTGRNLVASQTEGFIPKDGSNLPEVAATTHFTYTPTGQKQSESNPRNPAWLTTYVYGVCCDRLQSVTDALGFITRYSYDSLGRVTSTTDANQHTVGTTFDAQGRVTSRVDGNGKVTTMAYDEDLTDGVGLDATYRTYVSDLGFGPGATGSAELTTAPTGEITLVIHDGLGRVVRQVSGTTAPTVMTNRYDLPSVNGLEPVQMTDSQGHVTTQYRDGAGRVVRVEVPGGAATTASYDLRGNVVSQTDANGVTTGMAYDGLGRPVAVTDGGGATVQRQYDEQGNVISETDALGGTVTRVYDGLNRKISETDRLGHTTQFTYNLAGGLETITDAEGSVTTYTYDARNQLTSETFAGASGGTRRSTSDAGGLTQTHTDQRGIVTTLVYDAANRLQKRRSATGTEDTFTYDDAGRLLTAVSGRYGTTITRSYQDGLLHRETQQRPDGSATLTWVYDTLRRPIRIDLDDGTSVTTTWSERGEVTSGGIIASGTNSGASPPAFTRRYDDGGRILETRFANGLTEQKSYTAANQVAGVQVVPTPAPAPVQAPVVTPPPLLALAYTYDANRRKTAEQDHSPEGEAQTFAYDAEDRLKTWLRTPGSTHTGSDQQSWLLSPVGDWRQTTINGTTQVRTHSPVHAVTSIASVPLAYDANGNLTRDAHGRVATWDADNRLASIQAHDATENVSSTATMCYDALGRRLSRTAFGRTTVFVLNNTQVIQERDAKRRVSAAEVASDGELPAEDAPAPEGSVLDLPGTRHLNFQPAAEGIPEGWIADKGRALAVRTNGLTYGWAQGATPTALSAGTSVVHEVMPQPELDTAHVLTAADAAATWHATLPNGTYAVIVVAGDPASRVHTNHLHLNGQTLTDPDPYAPTANPGYNQGDYDGWAVDVEVTNGELTLTSSTGALDPTLCLVEIGPRGSVVDEALRTKLADLIERATNRTAGPPKLQPPSPRTYAYAGDYIDAPLAMKAGQGAAAQTYFVHANSLYSPLMVTDDHGFVTERYAYSAYGERSVLGGYSSTTSRIGFNHGFTGLRDDGGLLFARNRYFSPELGRWISRDEEFYDGYNLYTGYFVPNAVDPEGKYLKPVWSPAFLSYIRGGKVLQYSTAYRFASSGNSFGGFAGIASIGHFAINVLELQYSILEDIQTSRRIFEEAEERLTYDRFLAEQSRSGVDIGWFERQRLFLMGLLDEDDLLVWDDQAYSELDIASADGEAVTAGNLSPGNQTTCEGPGAFMQVNETMSARSRSYQLSKTKLPFNIGYVVTNLLTGKPVKFDDFRGGVLIDAKGPGYAKFLVKNYKWWRGAKGLIEQAKRQQQAANGYKIRWYFAEEKAADAVRALFEGEGGISIEIVYSP